MLKCARGALSPTDHKIIWPAKIADTIYISRFLQPFDRRNVLAIMRYLVFWKRIQNLTVQYYSQFQEHYCGDENSFF